MAKHFVSNRDESPRMFKSDFLEFFSKVHWTVPIIIYIPLIIYLSYISFSRYNITLGAFILLFIFGWLAWTLTEYLLHRFIFHYEPKSEWGKKIHWTFHGVHHDYPQDSLRLVMPPSVSIPLAIIFYTIYRLIFGIELVHPFFGGYVLGYLIYDISHYAIHHFAFKNRFLLKIKTHHMKHHYTEPELGFGVSNPIWDYVFGTTFKERDKG